MGFEIADAKSAAILIKQLAGTTMSSFFTDVQVRMKAHPVTVEILFRDPSGQAAASFCLTQQTNCCGALVSTGTYVYEPWRGKGVAQEMQILKEAIAREFGYSALVATVNMTGNPSEVHILEKCGWKKGWEFKNSRTQNMVGFFFKSLEK